MQRSWNYQERWRTIPEAAKNTTIPSTSRKQKTQTTQLELSRTLENISSASQQYCSVLNFKEAKESNNVAGIIKNAEQHFLWVSRILQRLHVHRRRLELARKLDISCQSSRRMEKMVQIRTLNNIPSLLVANSTNCLQVQRKIKKNGK